MILAIGARFISLFKHVHTLETLRASVIAQYRKGARGKVYVRGSIEHCTDCNSTFVVPEDPNMQIVPLLKPGEKAA